MKTTREFIEEIEVKKSNLLHIGERGKINGSLLISIEKAMQGYANQESESIRKTIDQLLSKIRSQEDTIKFGFSEGTPLEHHKAQYAEKDARIAQLEKLVKELKEELKEELNPNNRGRDINYDLLKP